MGTYVGGPGGRPPAAVMSDREQRVPPLILGQPREQRRVLFQLHLVDAEHRRPCLVEPREDRMFRHDQLGARPLGHLDPVVPGQAGDRQDLLDRGAPPAGLAVDPLEREVAAGHEQPAAVRDVIADEFQAVRDGAGVQPDRGRQKQRVGADVRQDDRIIAGQSIHLEGELLGGLVRGHVGDAKAFGFERGDEGLSSEMKGHAAELVEPFVVRGRAHPAFADEKQFLGHLVFLRLRSHQRRAADCRSSGG